MGQEHKPVQIRWVKAEGRVAVRDVVARQTKDDDLYKVTACIDASKVNLVDKNGKSVVPLKVLAECPTTTPSRTTSESGTSSRKR